MRPLPPIKVHSQPSAIAVDREHDVWVAHRDGKVTRIRPRTREGPIKPLDDVQVGSEEPGQVSIAAALGGFVWVMKREPHSQKGLLARIDSFEGEIDRRIPLTAPDNVGFGAASVWVTHDTGRLTRLDASAPKQRTYGDTRGGDPHGLWVGNGGCAYVATYPHPNGFVAFDTERVRRIGVYDVGGAGEIAAGAGFLWLTGQKGDRAVLRVDPKQPHKADRIALPVPPDIDALAAGASGAWTADGDRFVVRIHPLRQRPERIPVEGGPVGIAVDDDRGLVWVAQEDSGQVTLIDRAPTRHAGR